jgi:transposase
MLARMREKPYPTDISDKEWRYSKAYLPAAKPYGRPRLHDPQETLGGAGRPPTTARLSYRGGPTNSESYFSATTSRGN